MPPRSWPCAPRENKDTLPLPTRWLGNIRKRLVPGQKRMEIDRRSFDRRRYRPTPVAGAEA